MLKKIGIINLNRLVRYLPLALYFSLIMQNAIAIPPSSYSWKTSFSDEFEGKELNRQKWNTSYPYNRRTTPTNQELEWYVDDAFSVNNGILRIKAERKDTNGYHYTSGILTTYQKFQQKYGYFEMRAKLPSGQGLWPAFWLLPASNVNLPEIDIMEVLGHEPTKLYTTYHYSVNGTVEHAASVCTTPDLSKAFHIYGVYWSPDTIRWYLDNRPIYETHTHVSDAAEAYILANLAVGGQWPGYPTALTQFPAYYEIDYIRVYSQLNPASTNPDSLKP